MTDIRQINHERDLEWAANELETLAQRLRNGKQVNIIDRYTRESHTNVLRDLGKLASETVYSIADVLEDSFCERINS